MQRQDHAVFGNGRPGLVAVAAELRTTVNNVKSITESLHKDSERNRRDQAAFNLRMEKAMARVELSMQSIEKGGVAAFARLKKMEESLAPIIDWKAKIILRVTTMIGTAGAIFGFLWFVYDRREVIRAFFQ